LADQEKEKIGRPWSDDELNAIVADYFGMLEAELGRRIYVKSHHSAVLMERTGRTHGSIEFKHQNISAVLEELARIMHHGARFCTSWRRSRAGDPSVWIRC
jgi:hypothetical protein